MVSKRVVTCPCCSPSLCPLLLSTVPGKSINPPAMDCNHIPSDSLVPLGWRCGFCQQAPQQCQTTDSTHTWLTAACSRFPLCHEKEKTLECLPFARFHCPGQTGDSSVCSSHPPGYTDGVWRHVWLSQLWGRGATGIETVEARDAVQHPTEHGAGPHHTERAALDRPKCQGRETLPQHEKVPLSTASKPRSKRL